MKSIGVESISVEYISVESKSVASISGRVCYMYWVDQQWNYPSICQCVKNDHVSN